MLKLNSRERISEKRIKELFGSALEELDLLEGRAKSEGLKIYLKPRSDGIFIGSALRKIPVQRSIVKEMNRFEPFVKKYHGVVPGNLLELITFSGGIKKTIERLDDANINLRLWAKGFREVDYLKDIIFVLNRSLNICSEDSKRKRFSHPYCALCWRETESNSNLYCADHAKYRALRQKDKRKMEQEVARLDTDLAGEASDGFPRLLSMYIRRNVASVSGFSSQITPREFVRRLNDDWRSLGLEILIFVKANYPYTFTQIESIKPEDSSSWRSWIRKFQTFFDLGLSSENRGEDWRVFSGRIEEVFLLLAVIQRYEACYIIYGAKPLKPGPKAGTVLRNEGLRQRITIAAEAQIKNFGRTNATTIAKEENITPQRVSKLLKELGYNKCKQG